jgi:hypothetical protein
LAVRAEGDVFLDARVALRTAQLADHHLIVAQGAVNDSLGHFRFHPAGLDHSGQAVCIKYAVFAKGVHESREVILIIIHVLRDSVLDDAIDTIPSNRFALIYSLIIGCGIIFIHSILLLLNFLIIIV